MRRWLIEDRRVNVVLFFECFVTIPIADAFAHGIGAIEQLHETDTAFEQTPGEETIPGKRQLSVLLLSFAPYSFERGWAFVREIATSAALSCIRAASS